MRNSTPQNSTLWGEFAEIAQAENWMGGGANSVEGGELRDNNGSAEEGEVLGRMTEWLWALTALRQNLLSTLCPL